MADVDDRAQFFIVTGLVLAVLLVALALILNSAIYTGNLATRESSHDTRSALQDRQVVDHAVGRAIRYSNIHEPGDPSGQLDEELATLEEELNRQSINGAVISIEETTSERGTRIAQLDETEEFRAGGSNDPATDWTLMDNTKRTETFVLRMQRNALYDVGFTGAASAIQTEAFEVRVTEVSSGDVYHVYVFRSTVVSGNVYLWTVEGGSSPLTTLLSIIDGSCAAGGPEVIANFKTGTFGPAPDVENPLGVVFGTNDISQCSELSFYDPNKEYKVEYYNGDEVSGEYELITTRSESNLNHDGNFYDPSDAGEPFSHPSILWTKVQMEYDTSEVSYTVTSQSMRRRERVFTGVAPDINQFEVDDVTPGGGDPTYEVDWTVSDADEDLDSVTVTLYDATEDEREDSKTYTMSDANDDDASGFVTLGDNDGGDEGNEYTIRIHAVDDEGHVVFESVRDTADGSGP